MANWVSLVEDVQGQDVVLIMFGSYRPVPSVIITVEESTVLLISG